MLQAIITTGGKQYSVSKGDKILIEKLDDTTDASITFEQVLLVHEGDTVKVGMPYVGGAKVLAKILGVQKAKKAITYKYLRRKGYHKKQGHRQKLTKLEIVDILM